MAANLTDHLIIQTYQTRSGNTDFTRLVSELASQTFKEGVPVMATAAGFIQEWDANAAVAGGVGGIGISGFSKQPGANLASNGLGAPSLPFGSIGQPGTTVTYGSVQYQANAFNIPEGAPFSDGRVIFTEANQDTIFIGQFDNAAGAVAADWTPVQSDLNKEYGLTKDAVGHWYVDKNKATPGTNTVVIIVGFDPIAGAGVLNGNVLFVVKAANTQYSH